VAILKAAKKFAPKSEIVFPNGKGKEFSDMTLTAILRRMGLEYTMHGFRSSFRDWAADKTDHPREAIEFALAHAVEGKTEAAYFRSDLFARRRKLMLDWRSSAREVQHDDHPAHQSPEAWRKAVALYRSGHPNALLRLLDGSDPIPVEARKCIADIAKKNAPKPRGAPGKSIADTWLEFRVAQHYRRSTRSPRRRPPGNCAAPSRLRT